MPKVFTVMDHLQKEFFDGMSTKSVHAALPAGTIRCRNPRFHSAPILVPRTKTSLTFRGDIDASMIFRDGSFGILDFKTTDVREEHVNFYRYQLHSYALAGENPLRSENRIAPIRTLGLLCFQPTGMARSADEFLYKARPTWIEITRDDKMFFEFLAAVVDVLELPNGPNPNDACPWCSAKQ
jgi:hypothetical protein